MSNLAGALTPQSRPPTSLTNRSNALSPSMSLPIVKLTLPLAKPSMPSATSNRSKTEGAWQLVGNLKMPGMAIHHDT